MAQILVQTKGFEATAALRDACEKVGEKILTHNSRILEVDFFLETSGSKSDKNFGVKIKLIIDGGKDIFAEGRGADMYQTIRDVGKTARVMLAELD